MNAQPNQPRELSAQERRKLIEAGNKCPACYGRGWIQTPLGHYEKCPDCWGTTFKFVF